MQRYIVGITRANGTILSEKLLEYLVTFPAEIHVIIEETDLPESDTDFKDFVKNLKKDKNCKVTFYENNEFSAGIAQDSFFADAVMIVPCSTTIVAKIAAGISDNLICRSTEICLKNSSKAVIMPVETPLNSIHLNNLLTLSKNGVTVSPAIPMFYSKTENLEDVINETVGRILKFAGIENKLYTIWKDN